MNQQREYFGIAFDSMRGDIYVFGGFYNGKLLMHSEKYNVKND